MTSEANRAFGEALDQIERVAGGCTRLEYLTLTPGERAIMLEDPAVRAADDQLRRALRDLETNTASLRERLELLQEQARDERDGTS